MFISSQNVFERASKIISGLLTSVCCLSYADDPSIAKISDKVVETITNAQNIPGLKAEEFVSLKSGIIDRWKVLVDKGELSVTGNDRDVRPYFVALQGVVEHVLASELNQSVYALKGVIHTPMPATPLCTEGNVSPDLVSQGIANDPLRLFTVKARTTIVRDYLHKGGDLYVVYPKDGLGKRTALAQEIYAKELVNYKEHLFDRPLDRSEIPLECIGATYFFNGDDGKQYVFAIKMTQANSLQDEGSFGLWFGPYEHPAIQKRLTLLSENGLWTL